MPGKIYTVEELMLSDSFFSYCLEKDSPDKEFWEKEVEQNSDQKSVFEEAKYILTTLHGKLEESEIECQVEIVKRMIREQVEARSSAAQLDESISHHLHLAKRYESSEISRHSRRAYIALGVAALVFVLLGVYLFKYIPSKMADAAAELAEVTFTNGMGDRKTIELPDGSRAILNSNSSITLEKAFNENSRNIVLHGEAFFEVAKNPQKPFIVNSGAFSTTAVGTAFYVHARDHVAGYKVDLLEGKVKLSVDDNKLGISPEKGNEAHEAMLFPGEMGSWESAKMSFEKVAIDSAGLKQWITGKLVFKNTPVEKALRMLGEWYAVDIIDRHGKWTMPLTGNYDNEPLDDILKIICFSLKTGYSYSGNQVIIE